MRVNNLYSMKVLGVHYVYGRLLRLLPTVDCHSARWFDSTCLGPPFLGERLRLVSLACLLEILEGDHQPLSAELRGTCKKHIVKRNGHQGKNGQEVWWCEGSVETIAMSTIWCSTWKKETWRTRPGDEGCQLAVPRLFQNTAGESTWGSTLPPVGEEEVGMQQAEILQRGTTSRWSLATSISWRTLAHNQRLCSLSSTFQLAPHSDMLPGERRERRRRSGHNRSGREEALQTIERGQQQKGEQHED